MLFIFSTPVLIRHQWQLKTVVFMHWCQIIVVHEAKHGYNRKHASLFCQLVNDGEKKV